MENPPVYSYKLQFTESTAFAGLFLLSGVLRDGGVVTNQWIITSIIVAAIVYIGYNFFEYRFHKLMNLAWAFIGWGLGSYVAVWAGILLAVVFGVISFIVYVIDEGQWERELEFHYQNKFQNEDEGTQQSTDNHTIGL